MDVSVLPSLGFGVFARYFPFGSVIDILFVAFSFVVTRKIIKFTVGLF